MNTITASTIGTVVGVGVSLVFLLVPKLNAWYAAKADDYKKAFMLWVGIGVTVAIGAISCFNLYALVVCNTDGLIGLAGAFIGYAVGNQSVYRLFPEPKAVREAKANNI